MKTRKQPYVWGSHDFLDSIGLPCIIAPPLLAFSLVPSGQARTITSFSIIFKPTSLVILSMHITNIAISRSFPPLLGVLSIQQSTVLSLASSRPCVCDNHTLHSTLYSHTSSDAYSPLPRNGWATPESRVLHSCDGCFAS